MSLRSLGFATILFLGGVTGAWADTTTQTHGGDVYISGSGTAPPVSAERDVFAAGSSLTLKGQAAGDFHVAGFDVDVESSVSGNVYAAGGSVTLRAPIGEDLTAAGFTVRMSEAAETTGNVRLAGGTVTIDGPVGGALMAAGGEVILNSEIKGDVWLIGETLTFGPDAKIGGTLKYSSPDKVSVPERVIASGNVSYEKMDRSEMVRGARDAWDKSSPMRGPSFLSIFAGFLVSLGFFIVIGAIFLTFLPKPVERMRKFSLDRPGLTILTGVIGLSMLFGLVLISAMTIIGIPLVPIVILTIVAVWILGYILGAYVATMRAWFAFGGNPEPSLGAKLGVLAAGITLITLLNFIPFLGWIANFTLVLLGIGAMTSAVFQRLSGAPLYATDIDLNPVDT